MGLFNCTTKRDRQNSSFGNHHFLFSAFPFSHQCSQPSAPQKPTILMLSSPISPAFVKVFQGNIINTRGWGGGEKERERDYKELAYIIMESGKSKIYTADVSVHIQRLEVAADPGRGDVSVSRLQVRQENSPTWERVSLLSQRTEIFTCFAHSERTIQCLFLKFHFNQFSDRVPSKALTIQPNHWPQPVTWYIVSPHFLLLISSWKL